MLKIELAADFHVRNDFLLKMVFAYIDKETATKILLMSSYCDSEGEPSERVIDGEQIAILLKQFYSNNYEKIAEILMIISHMTDDLEEPVN